MLDKQHTNEILSNRSGHLSQLELDQLHSAIKQTYFELDKDLRKMVKDDSGCVCVGSRNDQFFKKNKLIEISR